MNWITNSVLPKIKAWVQSDDVPENLWVKCSACSQMIFHREYEEAFNCCATCGHHAPLPPERRFALLFDGGTFDTITLEAIDDDPLKFRDTKKYTDRLRDTRSKTGVRDAIAVAVGTINGRSTVIAAFDFRFMGGSMGRIVGNGIIAAARSAIERKAALITVPSTGGARMQEGVLSLMQMAKTCAALARLRDLNVPYISVLTHPTTGGVAASFSMLGDLIFAEPEAFIAFAGPRVIEQTIGQALPEGFQTSEYLLEHGLLDAIVPRTELPGTIVRTLRLLTDPIQ